MCKNGSLSIYSGEQITSLDSQSAANIELTLSMTQVPVLTYGIAAIAESPYLTTISFFPSFKININLQSEYIWNAEMGFFPPV